MYQALFEIILWFIFVKRKRKVTSLKRFLKLTPVVLLLGVAPVSSALIGSGHGDANGSSGPPIDGKLADYGPIDNEIDRNQFPATIANILNLSDDLRSTLSANAFAHNGSVHRQTLEPPTGQQQSSAAYSNQEGPFFRYSFFVSSIYLVAYCFVFIIGLVGNCVVMIVVIRSSRMRNVTNMFICNLAAADTLVLIICLPATLIGHLFVPWILGLFLCKLVSYLQGVAVSASINTLVAVSIERYLAICFPFKRPLSRRKARRWIVIIWIFSLTLFLPWASYFKTIEYQSYNPPPQATTSGQEAKISAQKLAQSENSEPDRFELEDGQLTGETRDALDPLDEKPSALERRMDLRVDISLEAKLESRTDDNEVNDQKINQTDDDFMRQRMGRPIDDQISKGSQEQRKHCELEKLAQWSILNSIYRFTLKLKTVRLYRKLDINSPEPADSSDERSHNQFGHLEALLNETFGGDDLLQSASFDSDHLERLIRQSSSIVCPRCFEGTSFLKIQNLNQTIRLVRRESDMLDRLADDLNKPAGGFLRYLLERFETSQIDLTLLERLNIDHQESAIRGQIEPIKESLLFGVDCVSDCDNSSSNSPYDASLCALLAHRLQRQSAYSQRSETSQAANQSSAEDGVQLTERLVREPEDHSTAAAETSNYSYEICVEDWPNKNLERTFFIVANLILNYLLPLVIISACYICIWMTVWQRSVPCETTTASETPTIELPHHSCRLNYARKQIDQQSTASSSKSTKSLLIHTFSGFKNNLFPNSRPKSVDNLNSNNLVINPERGTKNQGLIFKLKASAESDGELRPCHLCSNELDSNGTLAPSLERYLPPTLAKNRLIKDELIKESIDQLEKDKRSAKRSKAKKQAGQPKKKKSLLVCKYDQQPAKNQPANARQQIMITIDSSPTNSMNNSLNPANSGEATSSSVYRRLQNRLRILKKLLPGKQKKTEDIRRRSSDLEEKNYELANRLRKNGQSSEEGNGMRKAGNPRELNNPVDDQTKQLINESRLMKQADNELDFEIEQIDEQLEESLEKSSKSSGREPIPCRHRRGKEEEEQLSRLVVKRALSKQSFSACARCSNINNNCECKSHQPKQLIKSSKSTPITGTTERLSIFGSRMASRQRSSNRQHRLAQQNATSAQLNNRIEVILQRSRYKVAKMMILIILAFFICWLPLYIIFTKLKLGIQFTSSAQLEERITFTLAPIAQWVCYINSCLNPLVYGLNKKYRAEFKKLFKNVRFFRCLRSSGTTNTKTKNRAKPSKKSPKYNTSTRILKTSLKSHPSMSHERNNGKLREPGEERKYGEQFAGDHMPGCRGDCEEDKERSSGDRPDAERNRTFDNVSKLPNNNFVPLKAEEHLIKDQPRPILNRSLSDINLQARKAALRRGTSFSNSIARS